MYMLYGRSWAPKLWANFPSFNLIDVFLRWSNAFQKKNANCGLNVARFTF